MLCETHDPFASAYSLMFTAVAEAVLLWLVLQKTRVQEMPGFEGLACARGER